MEPKDFAKQKTDEEWQRRLQNFAASMCELVCWDHKPLEQALEYQAILQQEISRLRERIAELESQLTQRTPDLDGVCAHGETLGHCYVPECPYCPNPPSG